MNASPQSACPLLTSYSLLIGVSVWWAGSYILIKIAVADIPPATLAASRLLIAAGVLLLWLKTVGSVHFSSDRRIWLQYSRVALFGHALPLFLITWASTLLPVGELAVMIATTPLFTALLGIIVGRAWPSWMSALSLVAGFAGLAGFISLSDAPELDGNWHARLALLGAALSFATSGRLVAGLRTGSATTTGAGVMLCAIPMLLPVSLVAEQPWQITPSSETLAALLLLGILSTAVVYVGYYRLILISGPIFASMHHYLVPAFGLILGAICFGEHIEPMQILAGLLIAGSIFASKTMLGTTRPSGADTAARSVS